MDHWQSALCLTMIKTTSNIIQLDGMEKLDILTYVIIGNNITEVAEVKKYVFIKKLNVFGKKHLFIQIRSISLIHISKKNISVIFLCTSFLLFFSPYLKDIRCLHCVIFLCKYWICMVWAKGTPIYYIFKILNFTGNFTIFFNIW